MLRIIRNSRLTNNTNVRNILDRVPYPSHKTLIKNYTLTKRSTEFAKQPFSSNTEITAKERIIRAFNQPDDTFKNISLSDLIKNGASLHRVQYLLKQGVDPHHIGENQIDNALHSAARRGNAEICALLLYYGVDPSCENKMGKTAFSIAPEESTAKDFLNVMREKLQNNNIKTDGMPHTMMYFVKQKMINAMRPLVDDTTQESLDLSLEIEDKLFSGSEDRSKFLRENLHNLKPNHFIWFSNAFSGHALDFVAKYTNKGDLQFAITNRGYLANKYHSRDKYGQYYPKVYTLKAGASNQEKEKFINLLTKNITLIYDEYNSLILPKGEEFYEWLDLSQLPGVEELMEYGKSGMVQRSDNCIVTNKWAALDYIFSLKESENLPEEINKAYEKLLDTEIKNIVPRLVGRHLDHIIDSTKKYNFPAPKVGDMFFNMAEDLTCPEYYQEALFIYEHALSSDLVNKILDPSNLINHLEKRIELCKKKLKEFETES